MQLGQSRQAERPLCALQLLVRGAPACGAERQPEPGMQVTWTTWCRVQQAPPLSCWLLTPARSSYAEHAQCPIRKLAFSHFKLDCLTAHCNGRRLAVNACCS